MTKRKRFKTSLNLSFNSEVSNFKNLNLLFGFFVKLLDIDIYHIEYYTYCILFMKYIPLVTADLLHIFVDFIALLLLSSFLII